MKNNLRSASRLHVWGNCLLNKLSSISRNRRKRTASKKRRAIMKQEIQGKDI